MRRRAGRVPFRPAMTFGSDRNASFTATESGKSAETSGSSTTILEPAANRLAYGLRTALLQSYSCRISSVAATRVRRTDLAEVFFIFSSLTRGGKACAPYYNPVNNASLFSVPAIRLINHSIADVGGICCNPRRNV